MFDILLGIIYSCFMNIKKAIDDINNKFHSDAIEDIESWKKGVIENGINIIYYDDDVTVKIVQNDVIITTSNSGTIIDTNIVTKMKKLVDYIDVVRISWLES